MTADFRLHEMAAAKSNTRAYRALVLSRAREYRLRLCG